MVAVRFRHQHFLKLFPTPLMESHTCFTGMVLLIPSRLGKSSGLSPLLVYSYYFTQAWYDVPAFSLKLSHGGPVHLFHVNNVYYGEDEIETPIKSQRWTRIGDLPAFRVSKRGCDHISSGCLHRAHEFMSTSQGPSVAQLVLIPNALWKHQRIDDTTVDVASLPGLIDHTVGRGFRSDEFSGCLLC